MRQLACSIILLSLLILDASVSYACECGSKGSPRKELWKARSVFVGEVVEIKRGVHGEPTLIKFKVERYWKGVKEEFITISSLGGLCGFNFSENERWLIYAYAYGSGLQTDICQRTTKIMSATEDLKALGKAKVPKTFCEQGCNRLVKFEI
jgi:hypothetical protein